ncbi:hypothetical protein [Photobacterium leiognathi]|uniref:hypothetical protein n=1 Tax=Photobacterium leiognathi TaxID=553611 RepID=UPI002981CE1C|nr:hypothetical protein [Photobacterium leiognathi]
MINTVREAFELPNQPENSRLSAIQSLVKGYFTAVKRGGFAEYMYCLLSREEEITGQFDLPTNLDELLGDSRYLKYLYMFAYKQQDEIDRLLLAGVITVPDIGLGGNGDHP